MLSGLTSKPATIRNAAPALALALQATTAALSLTSKAAVAHNSQALGQLEGTGEHSEPLDLHTRYNLHRLAQGSRGTYWNSPGGDRGEGHARAEAAREDPRRFGHRLARWEQEREQQGAQASHGYYPDQAAQPAVNPDFSFIFINTRSRFSRFSSGDEPPYEHAQQPPSRFSPSSSEGERNSSAHHVRVRRSDPHGRGQGGNQGSG
ncbi:hypothetical protein JCM8097_008170 [Rhodosporidiobolus ruineniae]